MNALISAPDTSSWYTTQYGCLRTDPTRVARLHTFPAAEIPRGKPETAAPSLRVTDGTICTVPWTSQGVGCSEYRTSWAPETVDPTGMIEAERNAPQFAFRGGGPSSMFVDVESQLRRLDQPLGQCTQGVFPMDAPLFRNTVAPPPAVNVPENVQNAANPVAVLVRDGSSSECRQEADSVAMSLSNRRFFNPTRYDTMRFAKPFSPPGIGTQGFAVMN